MSLATRVKSLLRFIQDFAESKQRGRGILMLNIIKCCNRKLQGNIFCIGENVYLVCSTCQNCGTYISEIKKRTPTGGFKTTLRRKGDAAYRLYKKYENLILNFEYTVHKGSKIKEYEFYNKFGTIYNGNGIKVSSQEEFIKMTRHEINAILNKRFYAPRIKLK